MVAVQASAQDIAPDLAGHAGLSTIAAVNGPEAVVVSGDVTPLPVLAAAGVNVGAETSRLKVSHAFHSALMDPVLAEFGAGPAHADLPCADHTDRVQPDRGLAGRGTGDRGLLDPRTCVNRCGSWMAYRQLEAAGVGVYLELGPDATLTGLAQACLTESDGHAALIALNRADRSEPATMTAALATAHIAGVQVDWAAVFAGAHRVDLPTYAFQHRRFWLDTPSGTGDPAGFGQGASEHPLLGAVLVLADTGTTVFTGRLGLLRQPWLAGHVIAGTAVLPGTAFAELAVRVGDEVGCPEVAELTLQAPLAIPADGGLRLQVVVGAPGARDDSRTLVRSTPAGRARRRRGLEHALGVLARSSAPRPPRSPAGPARSGRGDGYARLERFYETVTATTARSRG